MDESELRVQLERHHASSYGWALCCCSRRPAEAEDVLQTAYMKILQGRARYDGQSAFQTWLFAVIRRTAADERRRGSLRGLRLARYHRDREIAPEAVDPSISLADSERTRFFREMLTRLPRRQMEVLHLVFYQDLSIEEAADIMGVTVGSARTHYERGKARLREWLNTKTAV